MKLQKLGNKNIKSMTAQNMCGTKTGKLYPMKHYFFFSESFRSLLYFGYCQYYASPTNLVADI